MKIFVYENYEKMSRAAAQFLAAQLMEKPCSHIGLTAGKTPMGLFQELIRLYEEGQHVFSEAWYYNLEEIIGYGPESPESYCVILRNLLLDHVGVAPERMRMPNGLAKDPRQSASALTSIWIPCLRAVWISRSWAWAWTDTSAATAPATR